MSELHSELVAYIACGDTAALADAITTTFAREGMRRIERMPLPVGDHRACESNSQSR